MPTARTENFNSEYLSALLNSINASVVATDADFVVRYWNQTAETIFGFTAKEVIGKKCSSVLQFSYVDDTEVSARKRLVENGSWHGKMFYKNKNGTECILDATVSTVKNKEGQTIGYIGVHRDVTECARVKTDLTTLMSALSNIDDNFFIIDHELKIIFIDQKSNNNLHSYFGTRYNAETFIADQMLPQCEEKVMEGFRKALAGIKTSDEINIKNKTGKPVWLQASYFPIREFDGSISHACLIMRDITAQKEIELVHERLYQSRKLFETFMENSPILSWICDAKGIIRYLNPAYLKAYHLKKEQIGKPVFDVFPEFVAQQMCDNNELVMQTGQPIKTIERAITPDGQEHIYQVVKFPVNSDDGILIGGWAIDLAEEISLRENLRKSLEDLQRSDRELKEALEKEIHLNNLKSRFVSMASHEFRTPLSTMLSSTFLLEKYTTTEQQANRMKHSSKIKESILHMNALLEDFLSVGKLDEGKTSVALSEFDLSELVNDSIEEIEPFRKKDQLIYYESNGVRQIHSDKKLLKNILTNLLSNACKFSNEDRRIWIETKKTRNAVLIAVKDEGMGICKEDQKYLFGTFFRGRNVQNIQGTGLGLHIIKRYAELLHGSVNIESEIEKGTTVTLSLQK
ncbi:MAG TPA: PAS domain-containing protein [Flavisolibacter sp.]|nr:PAS domain-containing protein [Flavisolibacter sp.]